MGQAWGREWGKHPDPGLRPAEREGLLPGQGVEGSKALKDTSPVTMPSLQALARASSFSNRLAEAGPGYQAASYMCCVICGGERRSLTVLLLLEQRGLQ